MPEPINRAQVKITINSDTKIVLAAFEDAVKVVDGAEDLKEGVDRRIENWWSIIAKPLETLTGQALSSKEYVLNAFAKNFDAPAFSLIEEYISVLNKLCECEGVSSTEFNNREISNKFLVIKELLIRLVMAALSVEENSKKDGSRILESVARFIDNLNSSSVLTNQYWFSNPTATKHKLYFATGHGDWLKALKETAVVIALLHSNKAAMNSLLSSLTENKRVVLRQLVAHLEPNSQSFKYEDFSVARTLKEIEAKKVETYSPSTQLTKSDDNRNQLIEQLPMKYNKEKADRISFLYSLLSEIENYHHLVGLIDMLFTTTGWVLVITGVLDLEVFYKDIQQFRGNVLEGLDLKSSDPLLTDQRTGLKLLDYKAAKPVDFEKPKFFTNPQREGFEAMASKEALEPIVHLLLQAASEVQVLEKLNGTRLLNTAAVERYLKQPTKKLSIASNSETVREKQHNERELYSQNGAVVNAAMFQSAVGKAKALLDVPLPGDQTNVLPEMRKK